MSSSNKLLFKLPPPLKAKTTLITNDYDLSQRVLGVGINGKVVECFEKKSGKQYALKVSKTTMINYHSNWVTESTLSGFVVLSIENARFLRRS